MDDLSRRAFLKTAGVVGIAAGFGNPLDVFAKSTVDRSNILAQIDPVIHRSPTLNIKPIPPGTVIDERNYKQFPELRQLLPSQLAKRLDRGATRYDLKFPIKIRNTRKLQRTNSEREWEAKNKGKVKYDLENGTLTNYDAGVPFPEPKDIHEVSWNFAKRSFAGDSYKAYINFLIVDKFGRRKDVAFDYWQKPWSGRTTIPPVPAYPGTNVDWKGTTVFTKPYDAAGFSILRFRYLDFNKDDDAWAYMPAIRRIRRFTGADVQDPLFGTDVTMDDYANFQQKIDYKNIFPQKIELGQNLLYGFIDTHVDGNKVLPFDGKSIDVPSWEIRKYYKLTYKIADKGYMYGKRVMWIDYDTYMPVYAEFYDQKDNLFRSWHNPVWWTNDGQRNWTGIEILDWINGSRTMLFFRTEPFNFTYSDDIFTQNFLKQQKKS